MNTEEKLGQVKKYYVPVAELLTKLEEGNYLPYDYVHLSVRQARKNKMLFYGTTEALEPLLGIISWARSPKNRLGFSPELRAALDMLHSKLIAYDEKFTEVRNEFEMMQASEERKEEASTLDRQSRLAIDLLQSKIRVGLIKLPDVLQELVGERKKEQNLGIQALDFEEFLINGIPKKLNGVDGQIKEALQNARTVLESLIIEVADDVEPLQKRILTYIDQHSSSNEN